MRLWFSIGFLVFSLAFTIYGLQTLDVVATTGRPGPGYFPLIIGILLIVCTGINCIKDLKERVRSKKSVTAQDADNIERPADDNAQKVYIKDTVVVGVLIACLIILLNILGSILSMMIFMFVFLCYFNRKKHLLNVIYSVLFPISVHFLFDVWLRAGLPKGLFGHF